MDRLSRIERKIDAMRNEKEKKEQNGGGGGGFLWALQIVFIVLKLVGVVKWSWAIVLIPLWIELGLTAVFLLLMGILYLILAFMD